MSETIFNDLKFLQVTINSNKLTSLLEKLYREINQQKLELQNLKDEIPTIKKSVQTSLQTTQNRIKNGLLTSIQKLRINLRQNQIQQDKINKETKSKSRLLQKMLQQSNGVINQLKNQHNQLESYIKIYDQNRLKKADQIQNQMSVVKQNIINIQAHMQEADKKFDDQFQLLLVKLKSILLKNNQATSRKKVDFQNMNNTQPQKQHRIRKITPSTAQNFARFSVRINKFQKSIQDMENMAHTTKTNTDNIINKQNIQYPTIHTHENHKQIHKVREELQKNRALMNSQLYTLKNKTTILQERILIQSRKHQKQSIKIQQLKNTIKKISQKKTDEQLIQILSAQMKNNFDQINQDLDKKLYKDTYQRQKNKLLEKYNMIHQNLTQKADKGQIKKALLFLQAKIKQLILLVANDQMEEKDGAIKKIPAKCLSCDKGLQIQDNFLSRPVSPKTNRDPRSSTRKIKRRHHMLSSRQQASTPK